jgi:hypothetical protein
MSDPMVLEHHVLKDTYRRVHALFCSLTGRGDSVIVLYGAFQVILSAYPAMGADALVARIESLIADHGPEVRKVIEGHLPGAPDYVLSRDWLYQGPEALLIADLARTWPSRLRALAHTTDFSVDLEAMASELNGR